jgi:hypothetical protein
MVLPRGAFTSGDGLTDQFQILLFDVVQRWLRKTRDYQILRPLNKLHAGCGRTKPMLWRLVQQGATSSLLTIQGSASTIFVASPAIPTWPSNKRVEGFGNGLAERGTSYLAVLRAPEVDHDEGLSGWITSV